MTINHLGEMTEGEAKALCKPKSPKRKMFYKYSRTYHGKEVKIYEVIEYIELIDTINKSNFKLFDKLFRK